MKYLSEHRKEIEEYMLALMSDEEAYECYGDYRESIGEQQGIQKGMEQERLFNIRNVMKNLNVTAEKAMETLGIPQSEYQKYKELL